MEVSTRETLLIEMHCCPLTRQQFLCSRRRMNCRALVTSQGQSLESSELWRQLFLCWMRCVNWDCHKEKISLRFVSLFSTCSPQEVRGFWAPHGLGRGNPMGEKYFEPFSWLWPNLAGRQGEVSNRQLGRVTPLSLTRERWDHQRMLR